MQYLRDSSCQKTYKITKILSHSTFTTLYIGECDKQNYCIYEEREFFQNGDIFEIKESFENDFKFYKYEWKGISKNLSECVQIHDIILCNSAFYLVMDYYPNTLSQYINQLKNNQKYIDFFQLLQLCVSIVKQIKQLHKIQVTHRNINFDNILINQDANNYFTVGIINFEQSSTKSQMVSKINSQFPAPEIQGGQTYDKKVDIYSFGVILLNILQSLDLNYQLFNNLKMNEEIKVEIIKSLLELIQDCTDVAQNRLDFEQVHDYLSCMYKKFIEIPCDQSMIF